MFRSRELLFGMLFISSLARAATTTLDFEAFGDSTSLTNQYLGFVFSNASIWTEGLSLNELESPAHSGTNVVVDAGGPMTISFVSPVLSFIGFFTYSSALTINAYDALNQAVGTTNSAFASNLISSGNPVNEPLQVSFSGGISSISITADLAGSSFALDDAAVATPVNPVPEPASGFMALTCLLLACIPGLRDRVAKR